MLSKEGIKWSLQFRVEESNFLFNLLKEYIIPAPNKENTKKTWIAKDIIPEDTKEIIIPVPIVAIKRKKATNKKRVSYDLTIDKTHTIVANGIVASNCMPIVRDSNGKPLRWHVLPPDQIKPRYQIIYRYMREHGITDQFKGLESFYAQYGVDLSDMAFVQEIDDYQIAGAWRENEIVIDITNPSNELNKMGYGYSMFERSIEATSVLLYAIRFQKDYFLKNFPDQMLIINGEVDPAGLEYFKAQLYANAGAQGNQRMPILPTNDEDYKVQLLRLSDTAVDMQLISLVRFFVAIKCAAYRIHPSTINLSPDMGERGNSVIANAQDQADVIGSLTEEGFKGLLQSLAHYINRALIKPWYDDLVFTWSVEDVPPEKDRIALWTQKVAMGAMADEWRATEGLPPLEEVTDGKYDGKVPLSPFILQAKEMDMQQEQADQMMPLEESRGNAEDFTGGAKNKYGTPGKPHKKPESKSKKKPTKKKPTKPVKKAMVFLNLLRK